MDTIKFLRDKKLLDKESKKFKISNDNVEIYLNDLLEEYSNQNNQNYKDKYLRLLSEFDNYKKRIFKEKKDIANETKIKTITSILDIDNDISIAMKNIKNKEALDGLKLILKKVSNFLKSHNIEPIQTKKYDADLHEVISVVNGKENKILDVISKGYKINGQPFRYPKIVLSKYG